MPYLVSNPDRSRAPTATSSPLPSSRYKRGVNLVAQRREKIASEYLYNMGACVSKRVKGAVDKSKTSGAEKPQFRVLIKLDSVEAAVRLGKIRKEVLSKYGDEYISRLLRTIAGGIKLEVELIHLDQETTLTKALLQKRKLKERASLGSMCANMESACGDTRRLLDRLSLNERNQHTPPRSCRKQASQLLAVLTERREELRCLRAMLAVYGSD